jgi:hypothetical protein
MPTNHFFNQIPNNPSHDENCLTNIQILEDLYRDNDLMDHYFRINNS